MSATVRTSPSPGHESTSAPNRVNRGAQSIWNQQAVQGVRDLVMALMSHTLDASHGTFNEVTRNQINNITTTIELATISDRGKL